MKKKTYFPDDFSQRLQDFKDLLRRYGVSKVEKKKTFRFSDDDRQRLQDLLKRYDPKKVDYFIDRVERSIESIRFGENSERQKERVKMITGAIKDLKFAIRGLENLKMDASLDLILSPRSFRTLDPALGRLPYPTMELINKAYGPLVELIKIAEGTLKVEKKKRGRPSANDDGLITHIASIYVVYIDIPYPYKGPFSEIISIVFNDDDVDRKRGVRDALKNVSITQEYRFRVLMRKKFNKEQFHDLTPDEQQEVYSISKQWHNIKLNFI